MEFGVSDQNNRHSHWIGGSTNARENASVTYFDYHLSANGKGRKQIIVLYNNDYFEN